MRLTGHCVSASGYGIKHVLRSGALHRVEHTGAAIAEVPEFSVGPAVHAEEEREAMDSHEATLPLHVAVALGVEASCPNPTSTIRRCSRPEVLCRRRMVLGWSTAEWIPMSRPAPVVRCAPSTSNHHSCAAIDGARTLRHLNSSNQVLGWPRTGHTVPGPSTSYGRLAPSSRDGV